MKTIINYMNEYILVYMQNKIIPNDLSSINQEIISYFENRDCLTFGSQGKKPI